MTESDDWFWLVLVLDEGLPLAESGGWLGMETECSCCSLPSFSVYLHSVLSEVCAMDAWTCSFLKPEISIQIIPALFFLCRN